MKNEKNENSPSIPSVSSESIKSELDRVSSRSRTKKAVIATIVVAMVSAVAVYFLNSMLLPLMSINGTSMAPTLENGSIVVSLKTDSIIRGDICCFYYQNRILCKRVIGMPGDSVSIDEDGSVFVNGQIVSEPYVSEKTIGEYNIEFPFTVPEDSYFVLGDNRTVSDDSRNSAIGCVKADKIIGRVIFCIWPFTSFGPAE